MSSDPIRLIWVVLVGSVLLSTLFWGKNGLIASLVTIGAATLILMALVIGEKVS